MGRDSLWFYLQYVCQLFCGIELFPYWVVHHIPFGSRLPFVTIVPSALNFKYKKYEQVWNCPLNGFRLLFLTISHSRLAALCGLVQEMPPSDFIWLTEQSRMFADGASAAIWARGGKLETPHESILGSLCFRAPISDSNS